MALRQSAASRGASSPASRAARSLNKFLLEFAAEHVVDAVLAQQGLVERRVQPVRDQARPAIQRAHSIDDGQRQTCGGVHRQKESDDVGVVDLLVRSA